MKRVKQLLVVASTCMVALAMVGCAKVNEPSEMNEYGTVEETVTVDETEIVVSDEQEDKSTYYEELATRIDSVFEPEFDATTGRVISFTDQAGNRIQVPEKIETVISSTRTPIPSVYCLFRGATEGLIGISPGSMTVAENSFLPNVFPEILDIRTDFMEGTKAINIEEMLAMKPDVVLCSAEEKEEIQMLTDAGILAVGFSTKKNDNNPLEIVEAWLQQLEMLFGEANNVIGIEEYGKQISEMISDRVLQLTEEEKPRVLIIYDYADGAYTVVGSNCHGDYWITEAGGINVAAELTGNKQVNIEQIYEWNPDKILITNCSTLLPEDLYNNVVEGQDWSLVKAVQEQQVYKFPLGLYRWFAPSSDGPLAIQWCAQTIQPELFEDIDMDEEIKDYFSRFYGKELTDEELSIIYNPAREAALNQ